jgi:hypothetical protein
VRRAGLCVLGVGLLGTASLAAHLARAQSVVAAVERPAASEERPTRLRASEAALGAEAPLASEAPPASRCPEGMVLVEGDYCPQVVQRCLRWLDPPGRFHEYRCAEYARPAHCAVPRRHERYCIDRQERSEASGLPLNRQSWTDAARACEDTGARVCLESEWTFACEGEEMRPYPYGWSRQSTACNADRVDLLPPGDHRHLIDHRDAAGSHAACKSPFGAFDMAGNVAEWVSVDGVRPGSVVVQKGNWWQPGKNACRESQPGHDRFYKGAETGFRCCASATDVGAAPGSAKGASAGSATGSASGR